MRKEIKILLILIGLLVVVNYSFLDSLVIKALDDYEIGTVARVIDGDTVEINNESIRLLGINSPERGEEGYEEAKEFLEERILGEEVKIYFGVDRYDRYYRKLGYIFLNGENINLESVREGYSNFYFPSGKDGYYDEFYEAWEDCMNSGQNLCAKGESWSCLDASIVGENLLIENLCAEIDLEGWSVKDEGRKKYLFDDVVLSQGEKIVLTPSDFGKDYVWTDSGDSIFIRDRENKLVYWDSW